MIAAMASAMGWRLMWKTDLTAVTTCPMWPSGESKHDGQDARRRKAWEWEHWRRRTVSRTQASTFRTSLEIIMGLSCRAADTDPLALADSPGGVGEGDGEGPKDGGPPLGNPTSLGWPLLGVLCLRAWPEASNTSRSHLDVIHPRGRLRKAGSEDMRTRACFVEHPRIPDTAWHLGRGGGWRGETLQPEGIKPGS